MSDSAQESQKRHFSKIRPHVLAIDRDPEFEIDRATTSAAEFIERRDGETEVGGGLAHRQRAIVFCGVHCVPSEPLKLLGTL